MEKNADSEPILPALILQARSMSLRGIDVSVLGIKHLVLYIITLFEVITAQPPEQIKHRGKPSVRKTKPKIRYHTNEPLKVYTGSAYSFDMR